METQEKKFAPISKQVPIVNDDWLDCELGKAMSEVVCACLTYGKQAGVTVKLKISPQSISHSTVKISHDTTAKLLKEKREGGIVFVTPDGNIQADNPAQGKLESKDLPKPEKPLKFVQAK